MARRYSKDDIDKFHDYQIWEPDRVLYLGSHHDHSGAEAGVDYRMAESLIKNLTILDRTLHDTGITIKMNNIGGEVYHGMAIYDAILTCQNNVTIIVYGHCMSMGSLILQAADTRIMTLNSRMLVHYGHTEVSGHPLDVYRTIEEMKSMDDIVNSIYLQRIKQAKPRFTREEFENMIKFECYLSSKQAMELGLCDKILGE
jgi:ATP-dependent Clp endopeptidase proteolytic subunit ClpP